MSKEYSLQMDIGKAKYVVNFHDGVKTHADGSRFFDIVIFRNKKRTEVFITGLCNNGYKERV